MVQLHSTHAGLAVTMPTADVDSILHLETPTTTVPRVTGILQSMRYTLQTSIDLDPRLRCIHNRPCKSEQGDARPILYEHWGDYP